MNNEEYLEGLKQKANALATELIEKAGLTAGQIVAVGCSSSEIIGEKIGSASSPEVAAAVFAGIKEAADAKKVYVAAQCCEHLNRSIIFDKKALKTMDALALMELLKGGEYHEVNVIPQPKAGGSFATAAYKAFEEPVALTGIAADAGLDIGGTLIGMHLKRVAVPLRLSAKSLGEALVLAARVRKPFTGGSRAVYDEKLL